MRLRQALKICRQHYGDEPWLACRHRFSTQMEAIRIARRKMRRSVWGDRRFPYIPTDEEMQERGEIMVGIFAGLARDLCGAELPPELEDMAFDFNFIDEIAEGGDAKCNAGDVETSIQHTKPAEPE